MSSNSEFEALIYLIDDPDKEVRNEVAQKILELGEVILPILKDSLESVSFDTPEGMQRINELIEDIEADRLCKELKTWAEGDSDLLYGVWLANKTGNPDIEIHELNKEIERIKLEVWLDLRYDLTALEKVNVLNHVMFKRFGFKGNQEDYHNPSNSLLNRVFKSKKGSPISLAVIYSLVAQRLYIPVYGVNLPQHFILAYLDIEDLPTPGADAKGFSGNPPLQHETLFYINPFNEGAVFGRKHVEDFLSQINTEKQIHHFYPCENREIVLRIFRNLKNSYTLKGNERKILIYQKYIDALQPRDGL
jgi:regulator of sirC expression with transglutaminase-like and TPR domain